MLIDTQRRAVDRFRRGADGQWVRYPYAGQDEVEFASVGLSCAMDTIYEDVELEARTLPGGV